MAVSPFFQFLQRGRDLAHVWTDSFMVGEFLERRDRDLEGYLQRMPRTLGFATFTGPNNDPYGTDRLMTGLSLTAPFEVGRRIRITVAALLVNDGNGGRAIGTVKISGAVVGRWADATLTAGYVLLTSVPVVWVASTRGNLTVEAFLQKTSGIGTVAVNTSTQAYLIVEDVGPA